jgi:hypothetical protein
MALSVKASGTQTAVIGTEHTLNAGAFTDAGVYVLTVDTRAMVNGDELELRAYVKTLTGDAQGYLVYGATYAQQQGDAAAPGSEAYGETVKASIPIASAYSVTFTLTQTVGTGRDFPWRVDTL